MQIILTRDELKTLCDHAIQGARADYEGTNRHEKKKQLTLAIRNYEILKAVDVIQVGAAE